MVSPGKAQSILVSFFFRFPAHCDNDAWQKKLLQASCNGIVLLMEEILQHLVGSLTHNLQGFLHPRWLFGIFSIKSIAQVVVVCVVFFSVRWKEMQHLQVAFGEACFVFL